MSRKSDHWAPIFEGINTSTRLADLPSQDARLFYLMLQTKLDDWGRATADPRKLNALVWPLLGMTEQQTLEALIACRAVGLLEIYESDGCAFLANVEHEQKAGRIGKRDHRKVSAFPDPSGLAPAGPGWPDMARAGPCRPSRAGARAAGLGSAGLGSDGLCSAGASERTAEPEPWPPAEAPKPPRNAPADTSALLAQHPALDTPGFRVAWELWITHRREKGQRPLRETAARTCLDELAAWGPERAAAAIRHSIAKDWKSIHEPDSPQRNGAHRNHPHTDRRPDGTRNGEYPEPALFPRVV